VGMTLGVESSHYVDVALTKMVDFDDNTTPSRQLLDQMFADCKITAKEQLSMHQSIAGIFSSVALRHSREKNMELIKKKWANKAKYENYSYQPLHEHDSLDDYISMRVDELLARRKIQVEEQGHTP
jgi:hypothetical protein